MKADLAADTTRELSVYEIWYGRNEPAPEPISLRAGAVSAFLERTDLRDVRFGEVEVLRRLYFALRDENWDTVPGELNSVVVDAREGSFFVSFDAHHRNQNLDFRWHGTIQGDRKNHLSYAMRGEALRDFRYCRIGFCLLHSTACSGRGYRGTTSTEYITGQLPTTIAPQRYENGLYFPLFDAVSTLTISISSEIEASFDFEGDLFEMEDQRNWTDGSFKTYSTPLSLGYPHQAHVGQLFEQRVSITVSGQPSKSKPCTQGKTLSLGSSLWRKLPQLGLGVATHELELSTSDKKLLGRLNLDHLRVDLYLGKADAVKRFQRAERDCSALHCGLELALFLTDNADLELLKLKSLFPVSVPVSRVLVFHENEQVTSDKWVRWVRRGLSQWLPGVPIGAGTNLYFADLNRSRPSPIELDTVAYSINPQVHASDERSLIENLEAQRDTVETARTFCGDRPIVVSPITLKPRFNPDAIGTQPTPRIGELPSAVDPRQMSLFAAVWTLGSIKQLAESGVVSMTYYETTGWRGIKETDGVCPNPELFLSSPGVVFPVYHVFADLAELKRAELIACDSSHPLQVQALAVMNSGGIHILLANLSSEEQICGIEPLEGEHVQLRSLDAHSAPLAMAQPLKFRAHQLPAVLSNSRLTLTVAPFSLTRINVPAGTTSGDGEGRI